MSEQVIRHRGRRRDENGKLTPESPDLPLTPIVIAPGAGSKYVELGREGETIACTVYFPLGTDIVNSDELTVRDERYTVIVNDWHVESRGVLEVACTRGQG